VAELVDGVDRGHEASGSRATSGIRGHRDSGRQAESVAEGHHDGFGRRALGLRGHCPPGTVENLATVPFVEVNVVDPITRKGYRFKGQAAVHRAGELFERGLAVLEQRGYRTPRDRTRHCRDHRQRRLSARVACLHHRRYRSRDRSIMAGAPPQRERVISHRRPGRSVVADHAHSRRSSAFAAGSTSVARGLRAAPSSGALLSTESLA
jgi:hypothetical protein